MASLPNFPTVHRALFSTASSHHQMVSHLRGRTFQFQVRAEASASPSPAIERSGRRQALAAGAIATCISLSQVNSASFAAEAKKGFQAVLDKKDGYSFLYPFGWQEVVIQGQDKVLKDVIEPLESVSVNMVETNKQDIRDLGSPQEVVEALIKRVLAPTSQKTKLIEASEHDVDGKAYYSFEFIAQAPNFTRHALGTICIGNGKFYTLTTGANERRWEKMKDKLHTVVDSFKIFAV
ncbi:psbP-like protein 1, chloroplastic isoform X2 [Iris pallida]|uniref:PsbP-like protein 1, chloroplastic isoform X2 n=1 Tax=Iris pallida TaxID=29817 RepID=A0AAX6HPR3_IRIPA|nr:psbP-like protein 1, chloroplastic isoform X2 [Iris pallida]